MISSLINEKVELVNNREPYEDIQVALKTIDEEIAEKVKEEQSEILNKE